MCGKWASPEGLCCCSRPRALAARGSVFDHAPTSARALVVHTRRAADVVLRERRTGGFIEDIARRNNGDVPSTAVIDQDIDATDLGRC